MSARDLQWHFPLPNNFSISLHMLTVVATPFLACFEGLFLVLSIWQAQVKDDILCHKATLSVTYKTFVLKTQTLFKGSLCKLIQLSCGQIVWLSVLDTAISAFVLKETNQSNQCQFSQLEIRKENSLTHINKIHRTE